jgi:hypothetical protein
MAEAAKSKSDAHHAYISSFITSLTQAAENESDPEAYKEEILLSLREELKLDKPQPRSDLMGIYLKAIAWLFVLIAITCAGGLVMAALEGGSWHTDTAKYIFFAFTVCSTIGYGDVSPVTPGGQMSAVAFALFSIPIASAAFSSLAEAYLLSFIDIMMLLQRKGKGARHGAAVPVVLPKTSDAGVLVTLGALACWIVAGMFAFEATEANQKTSSWSHVESLYFSVVTLSTVGLGDIVPVTDTGRCVVFLWASVGLGLLAIFLSNLGEGATKAAKAVLGGLLERRQVQQDNKDKTE